MTGRVGVGKGATVGYTGGGMYVREYGDRGPMVFVLHGGPAAVGDLAPVARRLADGFRVLEPWQRGSGGEPLTVARHVEDLHSVVLERTPRVPPAIVGHSWGAMLALCYAATHPDHAGPIVLVGCGTFDPVSRATLQGVLASRIDEGLQRELDEVEASTPDRGERHTRQQKLMRDLSVYELAEPWPERDEWEPLDDRAHEETWHDMLRAQKDGTYPGAFTAIRSPLLMLHGAYDPHPGPMIRDSLRPLMPQLEYVEWERCGHTPWLERHVQEGFFATLEAWLSAHARVA
jgi:pimeloyl-ACP methyl ester carboxylesterase